MEIEEPWTAIDQLADLPEGWDSYEAPRIAEVSRELAKDCLTRVQRLLSQHYWNPMVGPTPEAGVALIWRKVTGAEVNVLFSPAGARYIVLSPTHQVVQRGPVDDCERFALEVLKRLEL